MTTTEPHPCPSPPPHPAPTPPGILAACDGSDGSLWALHRAMSEAERYALPLYVLGVVNPSPGGYPRAWPSWSRRASNG